MGGRREVSIISHRPVTRSDLKQERSFFSRKCLNIFATGCTVIWSSCDKEQLYGVLKLQKRAARVILYVDLQASSVALFNKLSWIPFYEQSRIDKCSIIYKPSNGTLPSSLNDHIIINNNRHERNTRYVNIIIICPKGRRETEDRRTFSVSEAKL